ncbi:MAG: hypothetical protein DWI03_09810 [Planctomycetota bacterium]|nr:MAG: hypothetical protein DWI03_09810 [Planctomycetota bacterium]
MEKKSRSRNATPPTFADIAARKMRDRIEAYRKYVRRAADGEQLDDADLSDVADLLAVMSLPDYAWPLHVEATKRYDVVAAKLRAAVDAAPANRERSLQLGKEIEALQAKLRTLLEERRKAEAGVNKGTSYSHSLSQMAVEHAVVLADIDIAVSLRLEELNKRRAAS